MPNPSPHGAPRRAPFAVRRGLTLALGAALAALIVDSWLTFTSGARGFLAHALVAGPASYFLCICVHDAVHYVLHRDRRLNQLAGFALALVIGLPFPLLQSAHLKHHRSVGTDEDPEAVVYRAPLWLLPFKLPLVPFYYLRSLRELSPTARRATLLHVALVMLACLLGGRGIVVGWALPAVLAIIWFGFTTVYVPHSQHAPRLMRHLNAHSGWHDDHHRDVRYPFQQYAELRAWHQTQGLASLSHDAARVAFLARRVW